MSYVAFVVGVICVMGAYLNWVEGVKDKRRIWGTLIMTILSILMAWLAVTDAAPVWPLPTMEILVQKGPRALVVLAGEAAVGCAIGELVRRKDKRSADAPATEGEAR